MVKYLMRNYFNIKSSKIFVLVALFLVSLVFFLTDLQGSAIKIKENQNVSKTDKSKLQNVESSKNLGKADACVDGVVKSRESFDGYQGYSDIDPFTEMILMQERMDRLFNATFNRFRRSPSFILKGSSFPFSPQMDISESDDHYIVRMDLPGMNKADMKITFKGRNLVISGKRDKVIKDSEGDKAINYERSYGRFMRICSLPGPFDKNKTTAKYSKGVLTVTIAKVPEEKEKEITIEIEQEQDED